MPARAILVKTAHSQIVDANGRAAPIVKGSGLHERITRSGWSPLSSKSWYHRDYHRKTKGGFRDVERMRRSFEHCANENWQSGAAVLIGEFSNGGGSIDELVLVYRDRYVEPGTAGCATREGSFSIADNPVPAAMTASLLWRLRNLRSHAAVANLVAD